MQTSFNIGDNTYTLNLADHVDILRMRGADPVSDHAAAMSKAFGNPIGCPGFNTIIAEKLAAIPEGEVVIVISDNTRPVPYKGEQGILLPIIQRLMQAGVESRKITVLCANGTHTPLPDSVFRTMLDPAIYDLGIRIVNHDKVTAADGLYELNLPYPTRKISQIGRAHV